MKALLKSLSILSIVVSIFIQTSMGINGMTSIETSDYEIINVNDYSTVSGSTLEYVGSIKKGSNKLVIQGPHDFQVGQGIVVEGGSDKSYHNFWFKSTITRIEENEIYLKYSVRTTVRDGAIIHDDTDAINDIIKDEDRTYVFNYNGLNVCGLKVASNTVLKGNGTVFQTPISYNDINKKVEMMEIVKVENVVVRGFSFDGGSVYGNHYDEYQGVSFMRIADANNIVVNDNRLYYNDQTGIELETVTSNIELIDNYFFELTNGVVAKAPDYGSLNISKLIIKGNSFQDISGSAIDIMTDEKKSNSWADIITIKDNLIRNIGVTGINFGTQTVNLYIYNNGFQNTRYALVPSLSGITAEVAKNKNIYIKSNYLNK